MNKGSVFVSLGADGREDVERLLATLSVGLCDAILEKKLSVTEACDSFFVPTFLRLREGPIHKGLLSALHEASELENIERLVPHALAPAIERIRAAALDVLGQLPPRTSGTAERWIRGIRIS